MKKTILITGGSGFIGRNLIQEFVQRSLTMQATKESLAYAVTIINLDRLPFDIKTFPEPISFTFCSIQGDITDCNLVSELLKKYQPDAVMHLAAETHVDYSIVQPEKFVQNNIVGTFTMIEACRLYWQTLTPKAQDQFRFLQISTDEVYGSLQENAPAFTENSSYTPNNPYAASKASADHLLHSYWHTYGFPGLITHASNNFGPYQQTDKFIPLLIKNALAGKVLPIYGDGHQRRDWLYVIDHCRALWAVLQHGKCGQHYLIGGNNEKSNLEIAHLICHFLHQYFPNRSYQDQIQCVADRPGHDRRYAVNAEKIKKEIGWQAQEPFMQALENTVRWYVEHR